MAACTLGNSSETHSTINDALGIVDDHTTSTKFVGTDIEKSDVKDRKDRSGGKSQKAKYSINVGEIDVDPACSGEKTTDAVVSELSDYRGNSSQLDISLKNIVEVKND